MQLLICRCNGDSICITDFFADSNDDPGVYGLLAVIIIPCKSVYTIIDNISCSEKIVLIAVINESDKAFSGVIICCLVISAFIVEMLSPALIFLRSLYVKQPYSVSCRSPPEMGLDLTIISFKGRILRLAL